MVALAGVAPASFPLMRWVLSRPCGAPLTSSRVFTVSLVLVVVIELQCKLRKSVCGDVELSRAICAEIDAQGFGGFEYAGFGELGIIHELVSAVAFEIEIMAQTDVFDGPAEIACRAAEIIGGDSELIGGGVVGHAACWKGRMLGAVVAAMVSRGLATLSASAWQYPADHQRSLR